MIQNIILLGLGLIVIIQLVILRKLNKKKEAANAVSGVTISQLPNVVDYKIERHFDGSLRLTEDAPKEECEFILDPQSLLAKEINELLIVNSISKELCEKHHLKIERRYRIGNDVHIEVRGNNCLKLFHDYLMVKGYIHVRPYIGYNGGAESTISLMSITDISFNIKKKRNLEIIL